VWSRDHIGCGQAKRDNPATSTPGSVDFHTLPGFLFWQNCRFFSGLHSAISVGAAGIADASARCLPRLTRSPRFRLTANAPPGHLSDRSPARLQRVAEARISASKIHFRKFPHFSGFFRFENVHFEKIRSPRHDNAQVFANCLKQ
jgi:hypothetical protein